MGDEIRRVVQIDKTIFTVFVRIKRCHFDECKIETTNLRTRFFVLRRSQTIIFGFLSTATSKLSNFPLFMVTELIVGIRETGISPRSKSKHRQKSDFTKFTNCFLHYARNVQIHLAQNGTSKNRMAQNSAIKN